MPRVVVLGPQPLLDACRPESVAGALEVLETPAQLTAVALRPLETDALVAFGPSAEEMELLGELGLPALVWCSGGGGPPEPGALQRLVLADGEHPNAWRCVGLPVADRLYADAFSAAPAGAAWLGAPTPRRSHYLSSFEHAVAPVEDEDTEALVAVNLHDEEGVAFEHRAVCALAAGRLLVSETLAPARGLEPGIDYLAAAELDDVFLAVESAVSDPAAYRRVRLRGRRKAELFRASRVVGRLVHDLLLELDTPGSSSP